MVIALFFCRMSQCLSEWHLQPSSSSWSWPRSWSFLFPKREWGWSVILPQRAIIGQVEAIPLARNEGLGMLAVCLLSAKKWGGQRRWVSLTVCCLPPRCWSPSEQILTFSLRHRWFYVITEGLH